MNNLYNTEYIIINNMTIGISTLLISTQIAYRIYFSSIKPVCCFVGRVEFDFVFSWRIITSFFCVSVARGRNSKLYLKFNRYVIIIAKVKSLYKWRASREYGLWKHFNFKWIKFLDVYGCQIGVVSKIFMIQWLAIKLKFHSSLSL